MKTTQNADNVTPTAVERTPPEVWRMALLIAVQSPLRPRSGDDVLDGEMVFSICCHSHKRFVRTEVLRTQLRLVCQDWNAILKDVGHHVVFIDYHGFLQRVQRRGEASRKIRRIEGDRKCERHNDPIYAGQPRTSVVPHEDTQWVESLLIAFGCQTDIDYQFIMKVLDNAPRLRALEMFVDAIPRQYSKSILHHQALARVTHLSIRLPGVGHEERLCFPAVQHLRLALLHHRGNELIPDWQFPLLRSLCLEREDWPWLEGGDLLSGLDRFLALHGKTITSLLVDYIDNRSAGDEPWYHYSKKDFWRWFPNLRMLGPGMGALDSLTTPPTDSKLESLVIPGFDDRPNFTFDIYLDKLLAACKILSVTRLVMTDSWEDMTNGPIFSICQPSGWSKRFFEEAAANGIQVYDRDRIPITDRKGEQFLERLHDKTFSSVLAGGDPTFSGPVGAALPRSRRSLMRRIVDKLSILTLTKRREQ